METLRIPYNYVVIPELEVFCFGDLRYGGLCASHRRTAMRLTDARPCVTQTHGESQDFRVGTFFGFATFNPSRQITSSLGQHKRYSFDFQ